MRRKKMTNEYAEERRVFSFDLKEEQKSETRMTASVILNLLCVWILKEEREKKLAERGREFQITGPMY